MSSRLNIIVSDDLKNAIDNAAVDSDQTASEILRKAVTLYLTAREGTKEGKKLGLVDPQTRKLDTEIVGL